MRQNVISDRSTQRRLTNEASMHKAKINGADGSKVQDIQRRMDDRGRRDSTAAAEPAGPDVVLHHL